MDNVFKSIYTRATSIANVRGTSLDKVARFLSAEFFASFYVSRGKLWGSYKNERGEYVTRVVLA